MSDLGPKRAFFWDEATQTFRKAVVGEPGEYVWNTTTNSWEFGTVGAEYLYNHTTKSWEFGPGGQYVRNQTTNAWDKVTSPGYGGRYYWDNATNSWLKNAASVDVAEAYARWDFLNNQAWFGGDYVGALSSTPGLSFTRDSTGYAQTSAGLLVPFASGELRRTNKGALIEGARTNLCLQSQTFGTTWTKSNGTLTADQAAAPDGTTTADKLVGDAAAANGRVSQSIAGTIGATYTLSCFVKTAGGTLVRLYADDSGTNTASVTYSSVDGSVSSAASIGGATWTAVSSGAQQLGNGWWRFWLTFTATTAAPARFQIWHRDTSDGTNGLYLWGAQLEAASFPSSYIPTTTASATRAADVLTVPVSGLDYPLSLFAEFEPSVLATSNARIFTIGVANTNSTRLSLSSTNLVRGQVDSVSGGGAQMDATIAGAVVVGTTYKTALRAAANNSRHVKNGTLGTLDSSVTVPSTPTSIVIGNDFTGSEAAFSYLRRAAIYSRALTDAELQSLTT